jgi:hypothetical protein
LALDAFESIPQGMLKLEEDLSGQLLRTNGTTFNQQEEIRRLTADIAELKHDITQRIVLIQELTWDAQDTASAKEALRQMQDTLRDWCAHADLMLKLKSSELTY